MGKWTLIWATVGISGVLPAAAQDAVRFDRPVFTTDATVLCPRQDNIAAVRQALEGNDRAAADRVIKNSCKIVGPDLRLTVVRMPGLYDPDVEVQVRITPDLDRSVPRGPRWTLKNMVRN